MDVFDGMDVMVDEVDCRRGLIVDVFDGMDAVVRDVECKCGLIVDVFDGMDAIVDEVECRRGLIVGVMASCFLAEHRPVIVQHLMQSGRTQACHCTASSVVWHLICAKLPVFIIISVSDTVAGLRGWGGESAAVDSGCIFWNTFLINRNTVSSRFGFYTDIPQGPFCPFVKQPSKN